MKNYDNTNDDQLIDDDFDFDITDKEGFKLREKIRSIADLSDDDLDAFLDRYAKLIEE